MLHARRVVLLAIRQPMQVKGTNMAQVITLQVNKVAAGKLNYRTGSARAAWLAFIVQQHGKPLPTVLAAAAATPPSLQPKGKYGQAGKVEPPMGWVRYFARVGVVTLVTK